MQTALPFERLADDCREIIVLRRPAERRFDALGTRNERGGIAGAASGNPHIEIDTGHLFDDIDDFEHGKAFAVAAIADEALAALAKIIERHEMRRGKIRDLDIVADAGSVPCRIIGAKNFETGAQAKRRLHRDLDEMGCLRRRLTETPFGIGAGDVEIPEDHIIEAMGLADILQHPFGHQLGAPVGIDRRKRNRFANRVDFGLAIDRRGRGEDKMLDSVAHRAFKQVARFGGIVEIIEQGIGDRFQVPRSWLRNVRWHRFYAHGE